MLSTDFGVAHFYYSETVPGDAVGIAQVQASVLKPSDMCSINSFSLPSGSQGQAPLDVVAYTSGTTVTAPALMVPVSFTGSTEYQLGNQFFELTTVTHTNGSPLFYKHSFGAAGITSVTLFDLEMNPIDTVYRIQNDVLYHSLDGNPYWVQYYVNGQVQTELLHYDPTLQRLAYAPSDSAYVLTAGGGLTVYSNAIVYWIRWYQHNGYQLLAPYNVPLNDPWYPRIRFNLTPIAQEWGQMPFAPTRPFLQATWVPGTVLSSNVVEFERKFLVFDGTTYPDVLIFDKDFNLKYALDGTAPNTPANKGYLYPWMRSQFISVDARHARVHLNVTVEPTDQCFAFYYYWEKDVLFSWLDVNPFINRQLKNKTIEFYFASRADNPFQNIYYHAYNEDGSPFYNADGSLFTNDPDLAAQGVGEVFGSLVVGWNIGPDDFSFSDIRVLGGGLAPAYQNIPQRVNMWDLGFWDGEPYPTAGALPVYLPNTLLNSMDRSEIAAKLAAIVPATVLPLIRYYDPATGEESL